MRSSCATTDSGNQPELKKLMKYIEKNKVDFVIVPQFTTITKHLSKLIAHKDKIESLGAKLVSYGGEEHAMDILHMVNGFIRQFEDIVPQKWGICPVCRGNMAPEQGCQICTVCCNGKFCDRVKFGFETNRDSHVSEKQCNICNAGRGQYHHWGCDAEQCPLCRELINNCDCDVEVLMKR